MIIDKNCIGNNGLVLIGEALKYNDTIVHVDISSNDIGPDGFAAFFESLLENKTITSIDIASK